MTRKCPSCSADALDTTKFCIKCGTKMPALAPSPGLASPFTPPSPPPIPARVVSAPEPVSISNPVAPPVKAVMPQEDRIADKKEVQSSNSAPTTKAESKTSKSGGKGIIFAVIGVVVVGGGAFFLMSGKQSPTQTPAPAPAATIAPPPAATPVTPPAPVAPPAAPVRPAATAAPAAPVASQPAPKPAAPEAPASSAPDINKIMRDAANK